MATNCAKRRPIRVERSNEWTRRIGFIPFTPAEKIPATSWRTRENGRAGTSCRDVRGNSNASTAGGLDGSIFVAATNGSMAEFSPSSRRPIAYFGVMPNVCAKRAL
jgi:hypothetical protein